MHGRYIAATETVNWLPLRRSIHQLHLYFPASPNLGA